MDKEKLAKRISEKLDDISYKFALKVIDAVFESISEGLREDGIVTVGEWGTYTLEDTEIRSDLPRSMVASSESKGLTGELTSKKRLTDYPGPKPIFKRSKIE